MKNEKVILLDAEEQKNVSGGVASGVWIVAFGPVASILAVSAMSEINK